MACSWNILIVVAQGLKSQYQDEFILGFDKTLGDNWVYGAKATYRKLGNAFYDYCDTGDDPAGRLQQLFTASGSAVDLKQAGVSCYLFNPGRANTFRAQCHRRLRQCRCDQRRSRLPAPEALITTRSNCICSTRRAMASGGVT